MSARQRAEVYRKWQEKAVWKILGAGNAAVILSLLRTVLYEETGGLPSSIFHERISRELEELRAAGWYLPQTAQNYIADWLSSNYLVRNFPLGSQEEIYELSSATVQAIRFVDALEADHRFANESRLVMVMQQLSNLAEETNKDSQSRLSYLKKERAKIDAEIKAVHRGEINVLSDDRALERTREIILLADDLTRDFRQVRDDFQQLNRHLREQIVENEGSRGDVLAKLFSGVDVIAESDSGRTFTAFWRLLTDPEQSLLLENATEQILARDFSKQLKREDRRFLAQLTKILLEQGGMVHDVMQYFAKSLKHFVQSKMFQEQRRLLNYLRESQKLALNLKEDIHATQILVRNFHLTSSQIRSISQIRLFNPSTQQTNVVMEEAHASEFSLDMLNNFIAQSEINFRQLKQIIFDLLDQHQQVSIHQILCYQPATQGLGSIMGYLSLGVRYGVISEQKELISWRGMDGKYRAATIPCVYFLKENQDDFR